MYKFLSEDWIKDYAEKWNSNEKLTKELKDFSAKIKYFVEGKEDEGVYIKVENGKVVETGKADSGKYDFVLWASQENWKKLAEGDIINSFLYTINPFIDHINLSVN
ncbi:MAG: hypothetical protein DSY42_04840 [Aquifex sp.]|nr:MAG: hypothetical protein DSY42_04840 [Aquifex sp.]